MQLFIPSRTEAEEMSLYIQSLAFISNIFLTKKNVCVIIQIRCLSKSDNMEKYKDRN